jgi:hypothetical protein
MSAKHNLGSRRGWMWLVVLLVVLAALETVGALLITHRLLPPMVAAIVEAIVVNWTVVAMFVFASPLWGKVEVSGQGLCVRFGLVGSVRVPIEAILGAAPYKAPARTPLQLGAGFDEESRQVSLVRSTTSESVIVHLGIPGAGRIQLFKPVMATSLVVTTSGAVALADDISALIRAAEERAGMTGLDASSGT